MAPSPTGNEPDSRHPTRAGDRRLPAGTDGSGVAPARSHGTLMAFSGGLSPEQARQTRWLRPDQPAQPTPREPSWYIGKTVGGYQLERMLGVGGMGAVYLAADPDRPGEQIAVKLLAPHLAERQKVLARFIREARSQARLQHPHIVRIRAAGEDYGTPFIAMDLLTGGDLSKLIRTQRQLAEADARRLWVPLLDALDHAHSHGFVHRDIKPANVMLDHRGAPCLSDFGLVASLDAEERTLLSLPSMPAAVNLPSIEMSMTVPGDVLGTPAYMAPEQCSGDRVDQRADLYSFGVLMYVCVTGELPFRTKSLPELLMAQRNTPAPNPRTRAPLLSDDAAAIILRLLEKSPDERFPTAGDVARVLTDGYLDNPTTTDRQRRRAQQLVAVTGPPPDAARPIAPVRASEARVSGRASAVTVPPAPSPPEDVTPAPNPGRARHWTTRIVRQVDTRWRWVALVAIVVALAASVLAMTARGTVGQPDRADDGDGPGDNPSPADGLRTGRTADETAAWRALPPAKQRADRLDALREFLIDFPGTSLHKDVASEIDQLERSLEVAPEIPGFEFLHVADFTCGSRTNENVPVYRCRAFARALGLPEGTSHVSCEFVLVPAGTFRMGSSEAEQAWAVHNYELAGAPEAERFVGAEGPQRTVSVPRFLIGRTEVTQAIWRGLVGSTGLEPDKAHFAHAGDHAPVESVSWTEVTTWLRANGLRLPSEAEWEYACRAGTTTVLPNGDFVLEGARNSPGLGEIAWYSGNCAVDYEGAWPSSNWTQMEVPHEFAGPKSVAGRAPNAFGLYDMIGNVWEWVRDHYGSFESAPTDGRAAEYADGRERVIRGGGWHRAAIYCRSASRGKHTPSREISKTGFRAACSVPQ